MIEATDLEEGKIYETPGGGFVQYQGIDNFMGQTTFHFRWMDSSQSTYIKVSSLKRFLNKKEDIECQN